MTFVNTSTFVSSHALSPSGGALGRAGVQVLKLPWGSIQYPYPWTLRKALDRNGAMHPGPPQGVPRMG